MGCRASAPSCSLLRLEATLACADLTVLLPSPSNPRLDRGAELWTEGLEQAETLRLLDQIDDIKKAPKNINDLVRDRQYLRASHVLVRAIDARRELRHVSALEELGRKLERRREKMLWELVDELHRYLYLQAAEPPPSPMEAEGGEEAAGQGAQGGAPAAKETPGLAKDVAPERTKGSGAALEVGGGTSREAEAEVYIGQMVQALFRLGKVGEAVEVIMQRLKNEVSLIIDRAVAHAEDNIVGSSAVRGVPERQLSSHILFHFISHVYEKIYTVICRHSAAIREIRKLAARPSGRRQGMEGLQDYTEAAVWGAVQMELRLLLCSYLDVPDDRLDGQEDDVRAHDPSEAIHMFLPRCACVPGPRNRAPCVCSAWAL